MAEEATVQTLVLKGSNPSNDGACCFSPLLGRNTGIPAGIRGHPQPIGVQVTLPFTLSDACPSCAVGPRVSFSLSFLADCSRRGRPGQVSGLCSLAIHYRCCRQCRGIVGSDSCSFTGHHHPRGRSGERLLRRPQPIARLASARCCPPRARSARPPWAAAHGLPRAFQDAARGFGDLFSRVPMQPPESSLHSMNLSTEDEG